MPAVNPYIDTDLDPGAELASGRQQAARAGALASAAPIAIMNSAPAQNTQVNAAGTSENVALHVASIITLALIGIYILRQSGFRFVAAGSIGVGR